jgi:peptidoglycan pentaglycine glycine transferase (the first glycine)
MVNETRVPVVYPETSAAEWNSLIASLPGCHLLQTWEWGQVKAQYGWKPLGIIWCETSPGKWQVSAHEFQPGSPSEQDKAKLAPIGYTKPLDDQLPRSQPSAAALILQRTLSIGRFSTSLGVLYIPKGPLFDWANTALRLKVLDDIQALARQRRAIFIKIDPDVRLGEGIPGQPGANDDPVGTQMVAELRQRGWHFSDEQIQFRNTVMIDLSQPEEAILARMKQKTRYNIRLAERKGVAVRVGTPADWELLYRMYAETSMRDGFVIRDGSYYCTVWQAFTRSPTLSAECYPEVEPLIAEVSGQPVAAVVIFRFAGKAWYLSGMSTDAHREKMPNYLLQWEAMRRARAAGCTLYDLWGAPDEFDEMDSLWGVYRFKEGLGGKVIRSLGAWDYPVRHVFYRLYTQILPRLLNVMRRRRKTETRQAILVN